MRIVFIASGEFALPTLRWLAQSEHEIAAVVTQPERGAGRGRRVTATPVNQLAAELGIEVASAENVNEPEFVDWMASLKADLGLVIAFGQKLGDKFMSSIRFGCINLHASLLPEYRGAAPINWAIVDGAEKTGVTVFKIVEAMDAGPILCSRWTMIKPDETAGELHDRLAGIGVDAVQAALGQYASGIEPDATPQNHNEATKARKLKKRDGYVNFDQPAAKVISLIRGMTPWPGALASYRSDDGRWEKVTLVTARVAEIGETPTIMPGFVDERLYVAASDRFIELLEVKPSSGRIMTWADYVNGRHVQAGDCFETPE